MIVINSGGGKKRKPNDTTRPKTPGGD